MSNNVNCSSAAACAAPATQHRAGWRAGDKEIARRMSEAEQLSIFVFVWMKSLQQEREICVGLDQSEMEGAAPEREQARA